MPADIRHPKERTMTPLQAIHELISTEAAVPAIVAGQDGTPPAVPYIALRLLESTGFPLHLGPVAPDGMRVVSGHRDAQVELTYAGAGGMDAMATLVQRLQMERALLHAEALDLAVFAIGQMQQAPQPQEGEADEPHTQLVLGVRYTVTVEEDIGWIDTVNANGITDEGARP